MNRSILRSWLVFVGLSFGASVVGCSGPPVSSTISGEPICADYSIGWGGQKLRGGLRLPVRVRVLDDDDQVVKVVIFGKRAEGDPSPKLVLPDKNREYKVEWAQCVNERATAPVTATKAKSLRTEGLAAYDCGDAQPYKTTTLVTKKGDASSHALAYEAPPKPDCWEDSKLDEVADAGAPDAAPAAEIADAGAADAEVADASAADAGAPDGASVIDQAAGDGRGKPAEKPADKPAEKKTDKVKAPPVDR